MTRRWEIRDSMGRAAAVLGTVLLLTFGLGALSVPAHAVQAQTGSLTFSGDPGEYMSGGQSYAYDAATAQMFDISGSNDHNGVDVTVVAADGTRSSLFMFAPKGQTLTAGTYTGALRWPYVTAQDPELLFDTGDRSCSTSTGSFTVSQVEFGPYGYVKALDASFEQYCNGSTLALRGEVHLATPPPPPALTIAVTTDPQGTIDGQDGQPTVTGTVTCNKPTQFTLNGTIVQADLQPQPAVNWLENVTVDCTPGAPVPWTIVLADYTSAVRFRPGAAQLTIGGTAPDRDYPVTLTTGDQASTVELTAA